MSNLIHAICLGELCFADARPLFLSGGVPVKKLLIDTNNLCASILSPKGTANQLLKLGLQKVYEPVITEVLIAEFMNKCRAGMGKNNRFKYTEKEIDSFLESLYPMLSVENIRKVSIGRGFMLDPRAYRMPLHEVLYELTNRTRDDLLDTIWQKTRVMPSQVDLDDLHVMVGALETDRDAIITRNLKDFPNSLGRIQIMTPDAALAIFQEE